MRGQVDDGVVAGDGLAKLRFIEDVDPHRIRARPLQSPTLGGGSPDRCHRMALLDDQGHDAPADHSSSPGEKNLHRISLIARSLRSLKDTPAFAVCAELRGALRGR